MLIPGGSPWQCDELSRTLRSLPTVRILDSFGIPYLIVAEDGVRAHASAAASQLLAAHDRQGFWTHLRDSLVAVGSSVSRDPTPKALPSWGPYALRLHWTRTIKGPLRLVMFQASPHAESQGEIGTPHLEALTTREREVARLIAQGNSNKRIAASLGISNHTVRHHGERIFAKLGVRSRAAVAAMVASWTR